MLHVNFLLISILFGIIQTKQRAAYKYMYINIYVQITEYYYVRLIDWCLISTSVIFKLYRGMLFVRHNTD
jgi:hypothetical protein